MSTAPIRHPATTIQANALRPSARLPVIFLGHGSPMNAIEDNPFRRSWQALGAELAQRYEKPQLILCVSAHWLTSGWWLTAMSQPRTIHDFGGFPRALFDQRYAAPGAPDAAQRISNGFSPALGLDQAWGLDHGAWSVLKPMFPEADIPVVQLSMDYGQPAQAHYAMGRQLSALRDRGVLIVGSGNVVHNLGAMSRSMTSMQAFDWSLQFDEMVERQIQQGDLAALVQFQQLGAVAAKAHPTWEHYLPLLVAAGAADGEEPVRMFNASFQGGSISMRSAIWGG
ncbi:MAG: 4,5-DOPA dioxygenase extradiol [Betaproteobacteria bacterium]|nr:4,5-DOPA dioxygenase extradiol [Betaproteobacteria bacterium]